jgi:hypothetical protein
MPHPKPWRSARARATGESKAGKIAGARRRQIAHDLPAPADFIPRVSRYGFGKFGSKKTNKDAVP